MGKMGYVQPGDCVTGLLVFLEQLGISCLSTVTPAVPLPRLISLPPSDLHSPVTFSVRPFSAASLNGPL